MALYYKSKYIEPLNTSGKVRERWIYGSYSSNTDVWVFKDDTGSTVINMVFENTHPNKFEAIQNIYESNNKSIEITKDDFFNLR